MNYNNQIQLPLYNYKDVSKNSADGFSMYFFHVFENRAIVAPSITLWSAVQLTHITRALIKFSNWSYRGTTCKRRKGRGCFKKKFQHINPLTPNDDYSGRSTPLTSKRCILYIYSTYIGTEYFKHNIYSLFFPLQNAVCFIILTYLVPVLFTFYIQGVL